MKIHDVRINNWQPPGETWWNDVEARPTEPLIQATLAMTLSYAEYKKLLDLELGPEKVVTPVDGEPLSVEQTAIALRAAMQIIEKVGTTDIDNKCKAARDWMRKYFPIYAESGTW